MSVVVFSCEGKVIMDVHAILKELHQERELLNQAIVTLEILARGKGKRRGRPPRWLREGRPVRGDSGAKGRRPRTPPRDP